MNLEDNVDGAEVNFFCVEIVKSSLSYFSNLPETYLGELKKPLINFYEMFIFRESHLHRL